MKLILDSGSTKTAWCIKGDNKIIKFESIGYNPNIISLEEINTDIIKNLSNYNIDINRVKQIYFYGAGVSALIRPKLRESIKTLCVNASVVEVDSDMVGAALALLGHNRGFAAILGTGANTCLFDGYKIEYKVDALGYLLGDEGSGCYMGKKLLADYLRGRIKGSLKQILSDYIGLSRDEIIQRLYTQNAPNKYCATFAKFISKHIKEYYYLQNIASQCFDDLFINVIVKYPDYKQYTFNSVGSVGFYFKDILEGVVNKYGMIMGKVIQSPIDGLSNLL